jgi:hypothetical protein
MHNLDQVLPAEERAMNITEKRFKREYKKSINRACVNALWSWFKSN